MNDVKELLGLKNNKVKIIKVEEIKESNEKVQVVTLIDTTKKVKCPICLKNTSSIHDKLEPCKIKYNKVVDRKCYLILIKRRFICHRCNKKIVEDMGLNSLKRTISNSLEIKIRKDYLMSYFTKVENIGNVKFVIWDMYERYLISL